VVVTLCSTPSGIMESVTHGVPVEGVHRNRCSTPSGIMESVTSSPVALSRIHIVLNAFRHHGIGHYRPWFLSQALNSAQRLPPSWNRSPLCSEGVTRK